MLFFLLFFYQEPDPPDPISESLRRALADFEAAERDPKPET